MNVLVTGACGFVGSVVAAELAARLDGATVWGLDNLSRPGSERNRTLLAQRGVRMVYGDLRSRSDLEVFSGLDWVVDAAANPSVLAGTDGLATSRQVVEHNLLGTVNVLELCKRAGAGLILLSTSRVYSIPPLAALHTDVVDGAFVPVSSQEFPTGVSSHGIAEECSCAPPTSVYGATKTASETLALEYGAAYGFPVWVDRCGVLAGAGQFGRADQGIFSYWVHSWCSGKDLAYVGFGGQGHQVRDCLHPKDLVRLILRQLAAPGAEVPRVMNVGGGPESARSLRQLSTWCTARFGPRDVAPTPDERPFDLPWVVLDPRRANQLWDWSPTVSTDEILEEIADHAERHPDWLALSSST